MKTTLRSTTALAVTLSMLSGPTWAQSDEAAACDFDAPTLPCTYGGELIETEDALIDAVGAQAGALVEVDATASAEVEAALAAEAQAAAALEAQAAEAAAQAETDAAAQEAAERAAADEAAAAAAAQAAAEEAAAMAEADAAAVAEAEAALAAEADAPAAMEAEAPAQAEADAAAEESAAAAEAAEEAATAAELEAALAEEDAAQESSEQNAEAEVEAEAEAGTDNAATDDDVMLGEGTVEADEPLPVETDMPSEAEATGEATLDAADQEPMTAEETVEVAPTTAAASGQADAEAEVTVEEVTQEDVRTADQDFETAVTGDVSAREADDDSGLSNFERAVLIGLGAVAIGAILDNGDEVVSNSGDRIVVQNPNGDFRVLKNDDVLLRQAGSQVETQQFNDGSTRTVVTRQDGTQVVTIKAADGRVLRRALVQLDGTQVELFDDTQAETAVDVSTLNARRAMTPTSSLTATEEELRIALAAELDSDIDRTFSLRQVRNIVQVRELAPVIDLDSITFETGSAAIQPDQARELALLGRAINRVIDDQPGAVFLIEGHTDAVGNAGYNLALSDRRAETVALALTEYFDVPAVNLITQGYGESHLKVRTLDSERANRRAVVRNVTRLLQ